MIKSIKTYKNSILYKAIILCLLVSFGLMSVAPQEALAQTLATPLSTLIPLSPAFTPTLVRGIRVYPDNPLKFDFIVDSGDSGLQGDELKSESEKLIRYFLASLTLPENDLWVNLSPYEKDRIVPTELGTTEMGIDMLAQDYLLKQITASLTNPDSDLGKEFWAKIYKQSYEKFGTTNVPVDTFNKVWIMPDKAEVYVQEDKAFIVESRLKVMLESDYFASQVNSEKHLVSSQKSNEESLENGEEKHRIPDTRYPSQAQNNSSLDTIHSSLDTVSSQIAREVFIPVLEKEVNEGKNFAQLRQIYNSIILSYWYKTNLKNSILNKVYADKRKVKGLEVVNSEKYLVSSQKSNEESLENGEEKHRILDTRYPSQTQNNSFLDTIHSSPDTVQIIYQQYLQTFKKGVCNMMKVEYDPYTKKNIPRKYFAGGVTVMNLNTSFHESQEPSHIFINYITKSGAQKTVYEISVQATAWVSDVSISQSDQLSSEDKSMSSQDIDIWEGSPSTTISSSIEIEEKMAEQFFEDNPEKKALIKDQSSFIKKYGYLPFYRVYRVLEDEENFSRFILRNTFDDLEKNSIDIDIFLDLLESFYDTEDAFKFACLPALDLVASIDAVEKFYSLKNAFKFTDLRRKYNHYYFKQIFFKKIFQARHKEALITFIQEAGSLAVPIMEDGLPMLHDLLRKSDKYSDKLLVNGLKILSDALKDQSLPYAKTAIQTLLLNREKIKNLDDVKTHIQKIAKLQKLIAPFDRLSEFPFLKMYEIFEDRLEEVIADLIQLLGLGYDFGDFVNCFNDILRREDIVKDIVSLWKPLCVIYSVVFRNGSGGWRTLGGYTNPKYFFADFISDIQKAFPNDYKQRILDVFHSPLISLESDSVSRLGPRDILLNIIFIFLEIQKSFPDEERQSLWAHMLKVSEFLASSQEARESFKYLIDSRNMDSVVALSKELFDLKALENFKKENNLTEDELMTYFYVKKPYFSITGIDDFVSFLLKSGVPFSKVRDVVLVKGNDSHELWAILRDSFFTENKDKISLENVEKFLDLIIQKKPENIAFLGPSLMALGEGLSSYGLTDEELLGFLQRSPPGLKLDEILTSIFQAKSLFSMAKQFSDTLKTENEKFRFKQNVVLEISDDWTVSEQGLSSFDNFLLTLTEISSAWEFQPTLDQSLAEILETHSFLKKFYNDLVSKKEYLESSRNFLELGFIAWVVRKKVVVDEVLKIFEKKTTWVRSSLDRVDASEYARHLTKLPSQIIDYFPQWLALLEREGISRSRIKLSLLKRAFNADIENRMFRSNARLDRQDELSGRHLVASSILRIKDSREALRFDLSLILPKHITEEMVKAIAKKHNLQQKKIWEFLLEFEERLGPWPVETFGAVWTFLEKGIAFDQIRLYCNKVMLFRANESKEIFLDIQTDFRSNKHQRSEEGSDIPLEEIIQQISDPFSGLEDVYLSSFTVALNELKNKLAFSFEKSLEIFKSAKDKNALAFSITKKLKTEDFSRDIGQPLIDQGFSKEKIIDFLFNEIFSQNVYASHLFGASVDLLLLGYSLEDIKEMLKDRMKDLDENNFDAGNYWVAYEKFSKNTVEELIRMHANLENRFQDKGVSEKEIRDFCKSLIVFAAKQGSTLPTIPAGEINVLIERGFSFAEIKNIVRRMVQDHAQNFVTIDKGVLMVLVSKLPYEKVFERFGLSREKYIEYFIYGFSKKWQGNAMGMIGVVDFLGLEGYSFKEINDFLTDVAKGGLHEQREGIIRGVRDIYLYFHSPHEALSYENGLKDSYYFGLSLIYREKTAQAIGVIDDLVKRGLSIKEIIEFLEKLKEEICPVVMTMQKDSRERLEALGVVLEAIKNINGESYIERFSKQLGLDIKEIEKMFLIDFPLKYQMISREAADVKLRLVQIGFSSEESERILEQNSILLEERWEGMGKIALSRIATIMDAGYLQEIMALFGMSRREVMDFLFPVSGPSWTRWHSPEAVSLLISLGQTGLRFKESKGLVEVINNAEFSKGEQLVKILKSWIDAQEGPLDRWRDIITSIVTRMPQDEENLKRSLEAINLSREIFTDDQLADYLAQPPAEVPLDDLFLDEAHQSFFKSDILPFYHGLANKEDRQQFVQNVLLQVGQDTGTNIFGERSHAVLWKTIRGVIKIAQKFNSAEAYAQWPEIYEKEFGTEIIYADLVTELIKTKKFLFRWKSFKRLGILSRLIENKSLMEELKGYAQKIQDARQQNRLDDVQKYQKIYDYFMYLINHPGVSDFEALRKMIQDPAGFLGLSDVNTPQYLHEAKKPSRMLEVLYMNLTARDLVEGLILEKFDAMQAIQPLEVGIYATDLDEKLKTDPELKGGALLEYLIKHRYAETQDLRDVLLKFLGRELESMKAQKVDPDSKRFRLVREVYQQLMDNKPFAKVINATQVFRFRIEKLIEHGLAPVYTMRIIPKSDPQAAVTGSEAPSCMSFGSGKNNIYLFNPSVGFVALSKMYYDDNGQKQRKILATSVLTADRWIPKNINHLRNQMTGLSATGLKKINLTELMGPDFIEKISKDVFLAADNVEAAKNVESVRHNGNNFDDVVRISYKKFFEAYFKTHDKTFRGRSWNKTKVPIGTNYSDALRNITDEEDNHYLGEAPVAYSDKITEKVKILKLDTAEEGQEPENLSGVLPLNYEDTLEVAFIENKAFQGKDYKNHLAGIEMELTAAQYQEALKGVRGKNLSLGYFKEGKLLSYIIGYVGQDNGKNIIYVSDFATLNKGDQSAGRVLIKFFENVQEVAKAFRADKEDIQVLLEATTAPDGSFRLFMPLKEDTDKEKEAKKERLARAGLKIREKDTKDLGDGRVCFVLDIVEPKKTSSGINSRSGKEEGSGAQPASVSSALKGVIDASKSLEDNPQEVKNKGGVDFNAKNMNVSVKGEGAKDFRVKGIEEKQDENASSPLPLYPSIPIDFDNFQGLVPVIINITPMNLGQFLTDSGVPQTPQYSKAEKVEAMPIADFNTLLGVNKEDGEWTIEPALLAGRDGNPAQGANKMKNQEKQLLALKIEKSYDDGR